jgi:ankyrin repeat protein
MHIAAGRGHGGVVGLLAESGADIHAKNNRGMTPLHRASLKGCREAAQLLIERGAVVDEKDAREGITPLHCAASKGNPEVAQILLEKEADIEALSKMGWRPLQLSASEGHVDVVRLLVDWRAEVNASVDGHTALYYAIWQGHFDIVDLLLEGGADPDDVPETRSSYDVAWYSFINALHQVTLWRERHDLILAAGGGNATAVRLLLKTGVDANRKDKGGMTALHRAVGKPQLTYTSTAYYRWWPKSEDSAAYDMVVKLLLDNGADIEAKDCKGRTALHIAVKELRENMVRLLLENGANIEAEDGRKRTTLQLALHLWDKWQRRAYGEEMPAGEARGMGRYASMVRLLLEKAPDSRKADPEMLQALLGMNDEEREVEAKKDEEKEKRRPFSICIAKNFPRI